MSLVPARLSADAASVASSRWPSLVAAADDVPADASFSDEVTLTSLVTDPFLQAAFAAAAVAVALLFAAKAVVNRMDAAVEEVAAEFDRVMALKYAKRWDKLLGVDAVGGAAGVGRAESGADRIQRVVDAMERLKREDPDFLERVMQDVERMKK